MILVLKIPSSFWFPKLLFFGNVMGEEVHRDEELAVVNLEHVRRISDTFRPNKLKKKGSIPKTVVQEIWKNRLAPRFYSTLMNVMFPEDSREVSFLSFYTIYKNLAEPEAEIMFRALTIYHIATIHEPPFNYEQADEYPNAPLKNIKDYVCDVITSYLHAIIHINMKEALGWMELRASNSLIDGNLVATYLLKDLEAHRNEVSIGSLEIWLEKNEIYYTISEQLYLYLFGVNKSIDVKSLIPFPIVQTGNRDLKTLLSLPDVLLLNSKLPKRAPRWNLAFMLDSRSGDWEKFKQNIYGRGQTLIVIQDANGDIFGMYGSQQWFPSSGFYGNDQSFLFTLKPEVNVYESSGRNTNFQIFTESGIGMGGTEEHFGLFINNGAKTGLTSISCSTFRQFWPLARELDFKIEQCELWIVSEDPVVDAGEIIIAGLNGDNVNKFDLLSDNLDISKLTTDFLKTEMTEAGNSKMMSEQEDSRKMKDSSSPSRKNNLEQKLSKTELLPDKNGNKVVKDIVEETKTEATSVVHESLQKQIKRSKSDQSRKDISAKTKQSYKGKSVSTVQRVHVQSCVQKCNRDLLRSPIAESTNVKTPHEKQGRRSFVHPSEGQDDVVSNRSKYREANDGKAHHDGSFVHPSLKPKQEPILQETLKNQNGSNIISPAVQQPTMGEPLSSQIKDKTSAGSSVKGKSYLLIEPPLGVEEAQIQDSLLSRRRYSTAEENTDDITIIKYPVKRNGKSLVDVQVQVGENKLLPSKCRLSSKKNCACTVKSPSNCGCPTPMAKNTPPVEKTYILPMLSEIKNNAPIQDLPTTNLPSSNNNNLENVQNPINEPVSIVKIASITEELPTATIESVSQVFQTSQVNSDLKAVNSSDSKVLNSSASKVVQESCSETGCRCGSSTETSSDWEGDGVANTLDRLKLKSECSCELNTTVQGDLDLGSKCKIDTGCTISQTLGQTETVSKLKEGSSSMCSCVLGPKDKGITSSLVKQQMSTATDISNSSVLRPKKENQELTRSSRKSNCSLESEECEKLSMSLPLLSSEITDGFFRPPKKETHCLTRSCRKSNISLESVKGGCVSTTLPSQGSGLTGKAVASPSQEKQLLSTNVKKTSLPCSKTRHTSFTSSCWKSNNSLESEASSRMSQSMPQTSHILDFKSEPHTCSSQEKQLEFTEITNESLLFSKKETQRSNTTSLESCDSARFSSVSIPPTCLTCRTMVKTSGCKCKTRSRAKLTPILEQASELLQQHRLSERSSILKSERRSNSKSVSKRGSSAVIINIQGTSLNDGCSVCSCDVTAKSSADKRSSRSCRCSGNENKSDSKKCFCKSKTVINLDNSQKETTITENSSISPKSRDSQAGSAVFPKKTCQCSLPRSCFPQFPEDHIHTDDKAKQCGCGTHAGGVIRFPTFPEPPKEDSQAANITSTSETAAASEGAADTEVSSNGKKSVVCPCVEEDGTIIILNVSKCNTMETLEKIVQELDVKYHPVTPRRPLALPVGDSSTKSKPCNAPEGFDRDALKRLLDSKMMGTSKEQSALKVMPLPE